MSTADTRAVTIRPKLPETQSRQFRVDYAAHVMDKLEFARMEARFEGVLLPVGLRVDSFSLASGSADMSWPPFELRTKKAADATVVVSEKSVADFLESKTPDNIKGFKVTCANGQVLCEAAVKLVMEIRAKAVCTLRIQSGTQVFVDVQSVDVMGGPAKKLVEAQLAKINPILDAAEFPMQVTLESVEVEDGQIVVKGKVAP